MSEGRWALPIAGLLFVVRGALELATGPPPPPEALLDWVSERYLLLALTNELTCFAGVALLPAAAALYRRVGPASAGARLGALLLGAQGPVLMGICLAQGRLVYPVYGLVAETPEVAAFALAVYHGGWHLVELALAASVLLISWPLRALPGGRGVLGTAVVAALTAVMASYPDLTGQGLVLVAQLAFAGWCGVLARRAPASP